MFISTELQAAFSFFDADNDGSITPDELGRAMSSLGKVHSLTEIENMVEEFDEDGEYGRHDLNPKVQ